ncbi:MAG: hypothetical protein NTV19_20850, partial [Burkholderiales bacterium]|nr:hypothetical protein [Burkholderiales bacterium]
EPTAMGNPSSVRWRITAARPSARLPRSSSVPALALLTRAAPVYVYGYLNGAEGPQVTTGPVSGVDGVEVSVIFDFGVGAIDWRGAWFNPGT